MQLQTVMIGASREGGIGVTVGGVIDRDGTREGKGLGRDRRGLSEIVIAEAEADLVTGFSDPAGPGQGHGRGLPVEEGQGATVIGEGITAVHMGVRDRAVDDLSVQH